MSVSLQNQMQGRQGSDWTRFTGAEVVCQGHLLQVSLKASGGSRRRSGRRSVVTELSAASRRRLMRFCARLVFEESTLSTFLTLTFPSVFPSSSDSVVYLRRFMKRLLRRFPKISCVWRKELQERGAPHFHLLLFGMPFVHKRKIQRWWTECVREFCSPEEFNRGVFTRIEAVRSWRRARAYVAKYMSKEACGLDYESYRAAGLVDEEGTMLSSGRWWGVVNGHLLPWAVEKRLSCPFGPWFFTLRRSARRIFRGVSGAYAQGFVLYVESALEWWRLVDEIRDTLDGKVCPF